MVSMSRGAIAPPAFSETTPGAIKMSMEDLVNELADAMRIKHINTECMNQATEEIDSRIRSVEQSLIELQQERAHISEPYMAAIEPEEFRILRLNMQIIDAWDGEKRTVRYGAGLLKIRTTMSLKIHDKQESRVLEDLLDHFLTPKAIMAYISGFNKTKLRAYMAIHPLPPEVAELVSKTTVKLEVE